MNVVIIGNSGAARECYQLYLDIIWASPTLRYATNFKGFLSYEHFQGDLKHLENMFLGDFGDYDICPDDRFVIGIGDPGIRAKVFAKVKSRRGVCINLISPWSILPEDCTLGEGNIITSICGFASGCNIGNGNYFNGRVSVAHDVIIGDFNFFAPTSTLLGGCRIGNGNNIGVAASILPRAKIGNGNNICPGACVFRGCGDNRRMAGNPALPME